MSLASGLFWFILAVIFAAIEIESEGIYGWAEKMPTWYRTTGFWGKLYGLAMSKKPLTGYHSFMFFLPVMIFHAPFFSGVAWSISAELSTMALYLLWCPMWDFLWFVLNPEYGLKNFKKDKVWWHAKSPWVLGIPLDYINAVVISIVLAGLAEKKIPYGHLYLVGFFLACTTVTIFLAPIYHNWYRWMRRKDDRSEAGIHH
ncbi:MAG: hypothetical protein AAB358_03495 [Patescibacteria group bacterium]